MGCDGGTIPKRDELVKTKKKPEQKDKNAELAHRWQNCAISQAPLQQPVVACELGRLYSKETILETLLDKSAAPAAVEPSTCVTDVASHIKTLRDVKTLNLTENPDWSGDSTAEKGDGYIDMQKSRWICPVTSQEMNGRFRFIFLWSCGCVMSEKALKEMTKTKKDTQLECLKCQKPFEMLDVIPLNPVEADEISALQEKMETRRAKAKEKKSKKKAKSGTKVTEAGESTATANGETNGDGATSSKSSEVAKNGEASTSTSKLEKRKADKIPTANGQSNGSNGVKKPKTTDSSSSSDPVNKLIKYSVAKDPKASLTYKSLFTSSEKAKDQQRAHWVTYNPFYN